MSSAKPSAIRRLVVPLVGILLVAVPRPAAPQAPRPGSGAFEISGPIRVIDGDTFEVYLNGRQIGIGIVGIKALPGNTPCGRRAAQLAQRLVSLIDGVEAPVRLRFEEDRVQTFDARKRRMYYLRLPGGVSAARALVAAGLAQPDGTGEERDALRLAWAAAPKCVN